MTLYGTSVVHAHVGEAICAGAATPEAAKAYLDGKYPRRRKLSILQVRAAWRELDEVHHSIRDGFWQDCYDMFRCAND
jgi:hypothetical protein